MKIISLPFVIAVTLALSSCAERRTKVVQVKTSDPMKQLIDISIEARDEMRILAKTVQSAKSRELTREQRLQRRTNALITPPGFEQHITMDFWGSAEEAFKAIARIANYEAIVIDDARPITPVMVRIKVDDKPLKIALLELGAQTGDSVDVQVFSIPRVMQLTYIKR